MTWTPFLIPDSESTESHDIADRARFDRIGESWVVTSDGLRAPLPGLKRFVPMFDEPDLCGAGARWIVASPPEFYFVAVDSDVVTIEEITCGAYERTWIRVSETATASVTLDGGAETLSVPSGARFLFLRRTER